MERQIAIGLFAMLIFVSLILGCTGMTSCINLNGDVIGIMFIIIIILSLWIGFKCITKKSERKVHFERNGKYLCLPSFGLIKDFEFKRTSWHRRGEYTINPKQVTCRNCIRILNKEGL